MKIIDTSTQTEITNPDLTIGELSEPTMWASQEAYATIDNITKYALADDDYEEVMLYHVWTADEIERREEAARLERREALLDELPQILADSDAAICELYEMMMEG